MNCMMGINHYASTLDTLFFIIFAPNLGKPQFFFQWHGHLQEGGGVRALSLRKNNFFAASLTNMHRLIFRTRR